MARLCYFLLISLCSLKLGRGGFVISTTPLHVEIGITENVTVQCDFMGSVANSDFHSISRLRIMKETDAHDYQIVVEAREHENGVHIENLSASAEVNGSVGDIASSFISISWPLATSDILGTYRCDIIGFKANFDVLVEKTQVIQVKESDASIQDALDLWVKHRGDIEEKIRLQKAYCDSLIAAIDSDIDETVADIKEHDRNTSLAFQSSLLQDVDRLTQEVARLKDTGVFRYWPEGTYALLTPDSGCPENVGALWAAGFRKFHTESTDRNYDSVSTPSHLQAPITERVITDNFMYQHFCVNAGRSPGPAWPRGSYCINQVTELCPGGFGSGFIKWQDEVNGSKAEVVGAAPFGSYAVNSTIVYYCCRSDGPAGTPIYLPKSRAFYLYRFNGACQEVVGMNTSPGNMIFDTDSANADAYQNTFHPDGAINDVHIELCYYSPQ
ncbi:hypothetical protein BsWGS_25173 [Bradybaena similaris]